MKAMAYDADEAERFARGVEDGRQLVHQRDHGDGEPRQPPSPAAEVGEEVLLAEQPDEDADHARRSTRPSSDEFHEPCGMRALHASASRRRSCRTGTLP